MLLRERPLYFRDHFAKAAYMQACAERDSTHTSILHWASQFRSAPSEWEKAAAILWFCQIGIDYVNDPGVEIIDAAPACLVRGFGDCDAKTILFIALCKASGIVAVVDPVFRDNGRRFPHVRALVFLNGQWWRVDPTIVNSSIGSLPVTKPFTNYWGPL